MVILPADRTVWYMRNAGTPAVSFFFPGLAVSVGLALAVPAAAVVLASIAKQRLYVALLSPLASLWSLLLDTEDFACGCPGGERCCVPLLAGSPSMANSLIYLYSLSWVFGERLIGHWRTLGVMRHLRTKMDAGCYPVYLLSQVFLVFSKEFGVPKVGRSLVRIVVFASVVLV